MKKNYSHPSINLDLCQSQSVSPSGINGAPKREMLSEFLGYVAASPYTIPAHFLGLESTADHAHLRQKGNPFSGDILEFLIS